MGNCFSVAGKKLKIKSEPYSEPVTEPNKSETSLAGSILDASDRPTEFSGALKLSRDDLNAAVQGLRRTNGSSANVTPVTNNTFQTPVTIETVTTSPSCQGLEQRSGLKTNKSGSFLSSPNATILVALYAYDSRADGDLSFQKEDNMVLLDDNNSDWWYVHHLKTGQQGYVPRNYVGRESGPEAYEWFAGQIPRSHAERLVLQGSLPKGTFLIREREQDPEEFALTIRDSTEEKWSVRHYKIKRTVGGGYYITTRRTFNNLFELVSYYSTTADGLCSVLTFAAPRIAPTRTDLSSDTQKNWEIPRSELQLKRKLGGGNFGEVWHGKWKDCVEVAVKTLKPGSMSPEAFLREAAIMKQCEHQNLVKLYAVCTKEEPFYIVTEYMKNGSLLEYLRYGEGQSMDLRARVDVCAQIANGMWFLEKRKLLVHRDLAARNVLVGEKFSGIPMVKIADFGLARVLLDHDAYDASAGAKFPIKWTAPEAAMFGNFTIKSDCWSYGVLMYEIMTNGQAPFPAMTNREVIEHMERGYNSKNIPKPCSACPPKCPEPIHNLMCCCWEIAPEKRPTFEYLYHYFEDYFVSVQPNYQKPIGD